MTNRVETLRRRVRDVVAAITPWDPVEADAQASVLHWIDSGTELFRHARRVQVLWVGVAHGREATVAGTEHIAFEAITTGPCSASQLAAMRSGR